MTANKTSFFVHAVIAAAVVIGIFIVLNLIMARGLFRLDITAEKRFSISAPTKRILSGLRDTIHVKAYVSKQLPTGMETLRRDLVDKFKELAVHAGGNFEYEFIDPMEFSESEQRELDSKGIQMLQGQQWSENEFKVINFYATLQVSLLDKNPEVIPLTQNPDALEYELMTRVVRLTQDTKPLVALHTDFAGKTGPDPSLPPQLSTPYDPIVEYLRRLFDVRVIKFNKTDPIPKDTRCLIVNKPKNLNQRQALEINRAASNGIPTVLFISKIDAPYNPQQGQLAQITTGLETVLSAWGVSFGDSILADQSCGTVTIMRSMGIFQMHEPVRLPTLPMIFDGLNRESVLTAAVPQPGVIVPWAASIAVDEEKLKEAGVKVTRLLRTSSKTWSASFSPMLTDDMVRFPNDESKLIGPQTVGIMLEGPIPFAYQGQTVPDWPAEEDSPSDRPPLPADSDIEDVTGIADVTPAATGKVIIVSSGDILNYQHITQRGNEGALTFFTNTVESLALGEDLIKMRSREFAARMIKDNPPVRFYQALNIGLMPTLVILVGVVRHLWRTQQKNLYLRQLQGQK